MCINVWILQVLQIVIIDDHENWYSNTKIAHHIIIKSIPKDKKKWKWNLKQFVR